MEGAATLEPCTVIAGPDEQGYVTLDRELPGPEGPTARWHVSRVFRHDKDLLMKVNGMAYVAIDLASSAQQTLRNEGILEFAAEAEAHETLDQLSTYLQGVDVNDLRKH